MRARRGFTLIEVMIVVAIIGILAAVVLVKGGGARKNANLSSGMYELALRLSGLRHYSMSSGFDHVLVLVDAANPDACEQDLNQCVRWFVVRPDAAFDIGTFDPDAPKGLVTDLDSSGFLPRGFRFEMPSDWRGQAPFDAIRAWDPNVLRACAGRPCFSLRFTAAGEVAPEPRTAAPLPGFAFVLGPAQREQGGSYDRRAVLVSFPSGIVKTEAYVR